jgi:predicted amidophosphoribosyltransferase
MSTNMEFKKGDWVIFVNYNEYPVQLEQDEIIAWVPATLVKPAGKRGFNKLEKNAKQMASEASKELWRIKKARKDAGV